MIMFNNLNFRLNMTHYTFKTTNNTYNPSNNTTDFSKILDSIILTDIKKQNPYLTKEEKFITTMMKKSKKNTCNNCILKDICYYDAINILINSKNRPIKFEEGTKYYIAGIPCIFYDDEIQIGFDIYSFDDLKNILFIDNLAEEAKQDIIKIAINIYI